MDAIIRFLKFGFGSAFGAAIGAGVASVMAPQKGEELQAHARSIIEQAKADGDAARAHTIQNLTEKYRTDVKDADALTIERDKLYKFRK